MSATQSDFDSPRAWAMDVAYCLAAGLVLGVLGPFGSFFNGPLLPRLLQWMLSSLAIAIVYGAALRAVRPWARRHGVPVWAWVPAVILLAAIPLSAATRVAVVAVWPFLAKVSWLDWYGQAVMTTLPLTGIYLYLRVRLAGQGGRPLTPQAPEAVPLDQAAPALLRRLPPGLGRDLLCLGMEDHYVRAYTPRGSDLILMSFGQALKEVGGLDGLQVHRSWWVARHAVVEVVEDGRNLRLKLSNGVEAPVSRSSVTRLRAAGWLV